MVFLTVQYPNRARAGPERVYLSIRKRFAELRVSVRSRTPAVLDVGSALVLAAKKTNPKADTSALEKQIDKLVYKLYDLTEEEIAIIRVSVK